ncbi:hypothetical protein [Marinilabilia salmonicolor]|uniref:hypothetical protein n=1 Tax=Marinilabilia salmonicolor TaxID=989 RepID=UPI000299F577|nr:hypothetical protein [Marinilabilia salmonicolor]
MIGSNTARFIEMKMTALFVVLFILSSGLFAQERYSRASLWDDDIKEFKEKIRRIFQKKAAFFLSVVHLSEDGDL